MVAIAHQDVRPSAWPVRHRLGVVLRQGEPHTDLHDLRVTRRRPAKGATRCGGTDDDIGDAADVDEPSVHFAGDFRGVLCSQVGLRPGDVVCVEGIHIGDDHLLS
jgi:hypothetical protein